MRFGDSAHTITLLPGFYLVKTRRFCEKKNRETALWIDTVLADVTDLPGGGNRGVEGAFEQLRLGRFGNERRCPGRKQSINSAVTLRNGQALDVLGLGANDGETKPLQIKAEILDVPW